MNTKFIVSLMASLFISGNVLAESASETISKVYSQYENSDSTDKLAVGMVGSGAASLVGAAIEARLAHPLKRMEKDFLLKSIDANFKASGARLAMANENFSAKDFNRLEKAARKLPAKNLEAAIETLVKDVKSKYPNIGSNVIETFVRSIHQRDVAFSKLRNPELRKLIRNKKKAYIYTAVAIALISGAPFVAEMEDEDVMPIIGDLTVDVLDSGRKTVKDSLDWVKDSAGQASDSLGK